MRLSVEVEGADRLEAALRGVAATFSDLRPAWRPVSDEIFSIVREQFATAGRRSGRPWEKHKASTLSAIRSANSKNFTAVGFLLRRSDKMFTAVTTRRAPGGIYDEQPDSLTLGTDLRSARGFPYPKAHQTGAPRANVPQRRIYDLTQRDVNKLAAIVKRSFRERIEDRGFDWKDGGGEAAF